MKQPIPKFGNNCEHAYFDTYQSDTLCLLNAEPCRIAIWHCPKTEKENDGCRSEEETNRFEKRNEGCTRDAVRSVQSSSGVSKTGTELE